MASANNIPVVPHGSSVFSYHVVTAFQNCPMSEFVTPELDKIVGYFGGLFSGEPLPKVLAKYTKTNLALCALRDW